MHVERTGKTARDRAYYGVFGCADGDCEESFFCFFVASYGEAIEAFNKIMEDDYDPTCEVFVNLVVKSQTPITKAEPETIKRI